MRQGDRKYKDYNWIITNPDIFAGKFIIKNTRLSVAFLLGCLSENMTADEVEDTYGPFPKECLPEVLKLASELADKNMDDPNVAA